MGYDFRVLTADITRRGEHDVAVALEIVNQGVGPGRWTSFAKDGSPDLFAWTDTCNVSMPRDGEAALLINLGDGSMLEHLSELGVKRVEWVLFTDHHREENQGASKLGPWRERGTKVAAPAAERALFERPLDFRKMHLSLGDAFTIHGASFVRPPIHPIPLDRAFATNDTLVWRGREIVCLDTRLTSASQREFSVRVTAAPDAKPGVHLLALDITRDSQRHGELFDAIIEVE